MDPVTTAAVASAATNVLVQAAQAVGDKLFSTATDAAADEATGLARRLLNRLLHRSPDGLARPQTQAAVQEALEGVVLDPQDDDAVAGVRSAIKRLLQQDPALLADVQAMLPEGPVASGDRSVAIGGDNSGNIITGDSNWIG